MCRDGTADDARNPNTIPSRNIGFTRRYCSAVFWTGTYYTRTERTDWSAYSVTAKPT